MEAPLITRQEIVFLLYHAYSLETIRLGREAYDRWRDLYEGTEYDPPCDMTNRFSIGLRDMVQRREDRLRRIEEEGGDTTAFMAKIRNSAANHMKSLIERSYPGESGNMVTALQADLEEQSRTFDSIVARARIFIEESG